MSLQDINSFRDEFAALLTELFEARTWTQVRAVTLGNEDGTVIVPTAAQTRTGALYATGSEEIMQVANPGAFIPYDNTLAKDTPVLVGKPPGSDVVTVMMLDPGVAAFEHFGGASPAQFLAASNTISTLNQLQFLLLTVSSAGGMDIAVTAGHYRRRNTHVNIVSQDLGSLAGLVPTTSGKALWVTVMWNHDTQGIATDIGGEYTPSGTLAVTNGLVENMETALTGPDYILLGAVYLYQGQTALLDSHVVPMQEFVSISEFDPDTVLTDTNGNVLSDSNGNIILES